MKRDKAIADLIALLYEAPGSAGHWREVISQISRVFKAPFVGLYLRDLTTNEANVSAGVNLGFEPQFLRSYAERYHAKNPFVKYFDTNVACETMLRTQRTVPSGAVLRSEFYNEWARPQKQWGGLSGCIFRKDSLEAILSLIRHRGTRPFDADEEQLAQAVLPHLRRSLELQRKISTLQLTYASAVNALDRWPAGVIVLGEMGEVLLMNSMAEKIVNQRDGLLYENGFIRASFGSENEVFLKLIQGAIRASRGEMVKPGGAMALSRRSSDASLRLLVAPIRSGAALLVETRPSAVVFIGGHEPTTLSSEMLREVYGMTPAEAKVAHLLAKGLTPREVAKQLHIKITTARTHLAHVLDKTGTRRQAELVRLLLSGPVIVGD